MAAEPYVEAASPAGDLPAPFRPGLGIRAGYGLGSLAFGITATVLAGSVLQLYFNQVIGLPAAWVGAAIMATILIDAVIDPLIGRFSDQLRTPWGRRHALMYAAALPSALGVYAMWHAPAGLSPAWLLAFMVAMLLFVRVATSFYEIPSLALAPELAPGYDDRTTLLAWRFVFSIGGAAAMNLILYQVFLREDAANPLGVLNRDRYEAFGVLAAVVIFVAIVVSSLATHSRIRHLHVPSARPQGLREGLRDLKSSLSQPQLVKLLFATLLNGLGGGVYFGLLAYMFLGFWGLKPQELALVLLAPPIGALIALWVVPRLSGRFGKRPFMMACYLGWLLMFVAPYTARYLGLMPPNGSAGVWKTLAGLEVVASTFAYGVHIVLRSMLADAADDVAVKTGLRSEGVLFAAYGVLDKWGQGLGALGAGLILTFVHFPVRIAPGAVEPGILAGLILMAIPVIAGANMVAMVLISQFHLDRAQHERNLAELQRRAAAP